MCGVAGGVVEDGVDRDMGGEMVGGEDDDDVGDGWRLSMTRLSQVS